MMRSKRSSSANGASRSSTTLTSRHLDGRDHVGSHAHRPHLDAIWRCVRARRFLTDAAAECLPEPDQIGPPSVIPLARQHHDVSVSRITGAAPRRLKVEVHSRTEVEGQRETQIVRPRQTESGAT